MDRLKTMEKIMLKKILFLICTLIISTSSVFAVGYSGKVKNLYVNSSGLVLVNLDNGATTLNCGDARWPLHFNVDGISANQWMSLLITARAQNKKISVGYSANETGRCSVSYFYFNGFDN